MDIYLNLATLVVSIALTGVILIQGRGAGLGGLGGGAASDGGGYHVRRGVERLLFNVTIGLSALFFALAILNVLIG